MVKTALLVAGLLLVAFGAERLFYAAANRQQTTVTCEAFAQSPPRALWLRVTGCEVDYIGAGFREWGGRIVELYFPARPTGWDPARPAPLVATTRDPNVLAVAETTIGQGRAPDQEQFIVMMLKIVTALRAARVIDGYARATLLDRVTIGNALGGLTTPISPEVVVIDLNAKPPVLVPGAATLGGLALLGAFYALHSKKRATKRAAEAAEGAESLATPEIAHAASGASAVEPQRVEQPPLQPVPAVPAPAVTSATRLRVMLLKLPPDAGPETIEAAPPIGHRNDVIATLTRIVPGFRVDAAGAASIARADFQLAIDVGPATPVYTVVVDARGAAALRIVKHILEQTGWRAFAARTGEFITPETLDEADALPHTAA